MNTGIAQIALVGVALLAGVAYGGDGSESTRHSRTEYRVVNLPALGGTASSGNSINDQNLVAGFSNLNGDTTAHATLWLYGFKFDLGTLGGPNSNVPWPVKNTRGLIAGIAQTAIAEPNGETWSCRSFFPTATRSGYTCLGVVWENGEIRKLPTFGGNNGFATGANNKRHVVGWAENTVRDTTCVAPQVLQFRAAVWKLDDGEMLELPPLAGDKTSAATAINEKGQVVGISGICNTAVGSYSAAHAVMWDKGAVIHLGNLGGIAWNTPMAINQSGDVVGFSNISKADANRFNAHTFLWTRRKGIEDLGTLPGDALSQALAINDKRQIVGISCTAGFASCRAFLWENGVMSDLNELVEPDYMPHLYTANDINEQGHITGYAVDDGTQESLAIWAIPARKGGKDGKSANKEFASVTLPAEARQALLQRFGLSPDDLTH